jgi:hypothetical protein
MPRRNEPVSPWGFVAMGGLACLLFGYVASLIAVPWGAVAALIVVWLVLFALAIRWFTPHPVRSAWLVVVGVVVWFGWLALGAAVWGW